MQGWVVRPGAEYGVDYVLYDRHPSMAHSSYCVLALTGSKRPEVLRWTDIEAASRVCADVRIYSYPGYAGVCFTSGCCNPSTAALPVFPARLWTTPCTGSVCPTSACVCLQPSSADVQVLKKLLLLYVFEEPGIAMDTPDYLSAVSVRCLHVLMHVVPGCIRTC